MNSKKSFSTNNNQPVAYDANGQPLYSHPSEGHDNDDGQNTSQAVHIVRPVNPSKPVISEEVKLKNARSRQSFPWLNLSENEYVVTSVERHVIGLAVPILLGLVLITLSIFALLNSNVIVKTLGQTGNYTDSLNITFPIMIFIAMIVLAVYIACHVFMKNKLFLTNESVIQEIQSSLFSRREQTVSLANIEDSSYTQIGIFQQIFNYGSIRLSTVGDENTYSLTYVSNPGQQIDILNNTVEAFKNGRPVER